MTKLRDFYGLLTLCALPFISRGFTTPPAFRRTDHVLAMTKGSGEPAAGNVLKYKEYIGKNEELFQKIDINDLYELGDGPVGYSMVDWETANEKLGDLDLLQDNDSRLIDCQRLAEDYRLALLLALQTSDEALELDTFEDSELAVLMKKRAEKSWKLQLSEEDVLIDEGNFLRAEAEKNPGSALVQFAKDALQDKMKKYEGLEQAFSDLFVVSELKDTDPATKELREKLESIYQLQMSAEDEHNYVQKYLHVKEMIQEINNQKATLEKIWQTGLSTKEQMAYFAKLVRVEQRMNPESSKLADLKAQLQEMLRPYGDLQAAFSDLITSKFE